MKLWIIHPKYLDSKSLIILWRESLRAKSILYNETEEFINHPQLSKFKNNTNPITSINTYLKFIFIESINRGHKLDFKKLDLKKTQKHKIPITQKQVINEFQQLKNKLKKNNPQLHDKLKNTKTIEPNPLFKITYFKTNNFPLTK